MKYYFYKTSLIAALCTIPVSATYAWQTNNKTVYPNAISGPITNPGVGIETFHNSWGVNLKQSEYPAAGIDYYRFYWSDLEPREGQYNFTMLDKIIADNSNKTPKKAVALRFMTADSPYSGSKIPQWLIDKGIKGQWQNGAFVPDLDDHVYLYYMERFLTAFGHRYDGNPNLSHIDIGMVGSWGEWHNSNFNQLPKLHERYTTNELNHIVDLHFEAFPKTKKVMLISGEESLNYAVSKGAGWRADCWGDWHHFSPNWSHMDDDYPYRLNKAEQADPKFKDAWKNGPISFEPCTTVGDWHTKQNYSMYDVQRSIDWALEHHASTLNLKSKPIPEKFRPMLDAALTKLGYRLRVKTLSHPRSVSSGDTLVISAMLTNEGVAPPYVHRHLAYRLVDGYGRTAFFFKASYEISAWLPGEHPTRTSMTLPRSLASGTYSLELAFVENQDDVPINLANEGKQGDGWYRLSEISVW